MRPTVTVLPTLPVIEVAEAESEKVGTTIDTEAVTVSPPPVPVMVSG